MQALDFLIGSLAAWRVAALLVREDGPWDVVARLRRVLAGTMPGRALTCFFCTSLWVAAPVAYGLAGATRRWPLVWLAVSGAAGLLERATAPAEPPVVDLAEAERLNEEVR
jgi:uncharacterized protein DUF1360